MSIEIGTEGDGLFHTRKPFGMVAVIHGDDFRLEPGVEVVCVLGVVVVWGKRIVKGAYREAGLGIGLEAFDPPAVEDGEV